MPDTDFTVAEQYLAAIETLGMELGKARAAEVELADQRIEVKVQAIREIIANGPNEFTGKPHSYSSAEAIVELHPAYQAHRRKQADNLLLQELVKGKLAVAQLRAKLMLEALSR